MPKPHKRVEQVNNDDSTVLDFEREKHERERWWREEQLMNERTTWLFTVQTVLAIGYAYLKYRVAELTAAIAMATVPNMTAEARQQVAAQIDYVATLQSMAAGIRWLGMAQASIILIGIGAACAAQWIIRSKSPYRHKLGVSVWTTAFGQATAVAGPIVCLAGWFIAWGLFG